MVTLLEQKFAEMVNVFRKQVQTLPNEMKSHVYSAESFQSPCQIHILSCKEYDLNLIIKTHDPEFGDIVKETAISHDKFDDEIANFLEQPMWKKLSKISTTDGDNYKYLLGQMVRFGAKIRDHNFDMQSTLTSFTGDNDLSTWELFCDVTNFDLNMKTKTYVDFCKNAFEKSKEYVETSISDTTQQIQNIGFGSYFYPFILIGGLEPSFKGQLTGSDFAQLDEYVYDSKFSNKRLVITKMGLVAIEVDNILTANKIINTIFGSALLLGLDANVNRLNEIASVSMKERAFVHSWQTSTVRTMMYDYRARFTSLNLLKIPVSLEEINEIIKTAEQIWEKAEFVTELELFLQSQTHLDNSEFLQSFNTSWLVIERYLRRKFDNKINSVSNEIRKHLDRLEISRIMGILKADGDITPEEFQKYDKSREPRNRIFHGKEPPTFEEAKQCLNVAMDIVRNKTGINKKFDLSMKNSVYL